MTCGVGEMDVFVVLRTRTRLLPVYFAISGFSYLACTDGDAVDDDSLDGC